MAKEKQPQKEQIKVTDKRIFTADGDIREEFRAEIKPADLNAKPAEQPAPRQESRPQATQKAQAPQQPPGADRRQPGGDRRRSMADRPNPGTPFTNFVESLIAQVYMSLGMLPNPYQPQAKPDAIAARQLIDILVMLQEKTRGNLTPDEDDFLELYLGELKLAFVKITKNLA